MTVAGVPGLPDLELDLGPLTALMLTPQAQRYLAIIVSTTRGLRS